MSPTPEARAARSAKTSLRRRTRIGLIAGGLALVLVAGAAAWAMVSVRDRMDAVVDTYFVAITELDGRYIAMVDAETSVRGYALTGDPVILEPIQRLVQTEPAQRDVADALVDEFGPEAPVVAARERATEAARRWLEEFALPTIAQVEEDGVGSVDVDEIEAGGVLFDEVQAAVTEYGDMLRSGRERAVAGLDTWMTVLAVALGSLVLAGVVLGTLLWVYLRRWVTDPLALLASDARLVAAGDTTHHVQDTGPGEVGDLARDVELMRERLALLVAEGEEAQRELADSHSRLEEQAEELRRSNRDLEQFAYVASHDLQEPLRKVASFTQLLAKRYQGQLDERADQYIEFAVDGAKRMQRLISDLLGFSRVGRIGGEVTDVDLRAVGEQVRSDLERSIEEAGAEVDVRDLPTVRGEAPLLTQLLMNLIGNALKFRHPDRSPVVRLEGRRVDDMWHLACHDNGIGIDPRYAERVFVIFQRLHAKDVYEGTGIGLALCKKIIEYHGGEIWIDAERVDGTTIRWTLPVEPTVAAAIDTGRGGQESSADRVAVTDPDTAAITSGDMADFGDPGDEHVRRRQEGP